MGKIAELLFEILKELKIINKYLSHHHPGRGGRDMSKCDNCELRKAVAKAFDLHWLREDDCPFECKAGEGE